MIFDEKFIIALAFFVCLGLIVKFSKNSFSKFLSSTKNSICNSIDNVENSLSDLKLKIAKLKDDKISLNAKHVSSIRDAENQRDFLLTEAEKKSKNLFENAINNQKNTNERIKNESLKSFEKISWDSAKEKLVKDLTNDVDSASQTHKNIINKILNEAINE